MPGRTSLICHALHIIKSVLLKIPVFLVLSLITYDWLGLLIHLPPFHVKPHAPGPHPAVHRRYVFNVEFSGPNMASGAFSALDWFMVLVHVPGVVLIAATPPPILLSIPFLPRCAQLLVFNIDIALLVSSYGETTRRHTLPCAAASDLE